MDVALGLDKLVPGAEYSGSLTENTEPVFDSLVWEDKRAKPLWKDIVTASAAADIEALKVAINTERDRRIGAGFSFDFRDARGVVVFDTDADARANIAGAHGLALSALVAGAKNGDLRWADASRDFTWIAADNSEVAMDARTTLAFSAAAMSFKAGVIKAGRSLKNAKRIPKNFASDVHWP